MAKDPEYEFDFMVSGVNYNGRDRIVRDSLRVGDRVRFVRDEDNEKDEFAVSVTLLDGRQIGYVPRDESPDVSMCMEDDDYYYAATVKKILTKGSIPRPVVVAVFFESKDVAQLGELRLRALRFSPDGHARYRTGIDCERQLDTRFSFREILQMGLVDSR